MGVAHDDEPGRRVFGEHRFRPVPLQAGGERQRRLVRRPVAEHRAHPVDEPEADLGVQRPVDAGRDRMMDQAVEQAGATAMIGDPVAVQCQDPARADPEGGPEGRVGEPEVTLPEVAAPAVVVAADHHDRHGVPEPRQRRRDVKSAARDDTGVSEPKIEEVAVDEQAIAERRDGVEKCEQPLLDDGGRRAEVGVGDDDETVSEDRARHGAKDGRAAMGEQAVTGAPAGMPAGSPDGVTEVRLRVNYSETDQMGVVYHARYLVWLDIARTEYLREGGMSYRELEERGYRLAVDEASVRYRQPARFDDLIRVRCWVREVASRRIGFGYAIERLDDARLLATAFTSFMVLDRTMSLTRLPDDVRQLLHTVPDPVKLHL
jgi:acyl-CoA thioester hydrolase